MKKRGFEVIKAYSGRKIILPERKSKCSAGYDIFLLNDVVLQPQQVSLLPTGLKAYMLADEYLGIFIRSGIALRHGLCLINGQGIIDSDYYNNVENEGHIMIAVFNAGGKIVALSAGMRIAQGIFYKYLVTDSGKTEGQEKKIRSGGFGSTGER